MHCQPLTCEFDTSADAAAHDLLFHLASQDPPSYTDSSAPTAQNGSIALTSRQIDPRDAELVEVNARWHIPLLICRALSTAPAVWWGLRCALTFLAELLLSEEIGVLEGQHWTVEKRFRVTEVFLAIVWVRHSVLTERPLEPHLWQS